MTMQRRPPAALKELLSGRFGIVPDNILSTSRLCTVSLEMARVTLDHRTLGNIVLGSQEPGFLLSTQVGPLHSQRVYGDNFSEIHVYGPDDINIQHVNELCKADLLTPFDFLVCHIPWNTIKITSGKMDRDVEWLACQPATRDPIAAELCRALLPELNKREARDFIFVDAAATALVSHLALTYGKKTSPGSSNGGLADWQKRRAIELLMAAGDDQACISVARIAAECRLSRSYFVRAFKNSTGLPPQQWLADYRLRKAKHLLSETDQPIAEVATRCGFADQSHLTRAFASAVGLTPAAWRKRIRYSTIQETEL